MRLPPSFSVALLLVLSSCDLARTGPRRGSLAVTVTGLSSKPAAITVTGPAGYRREVAASIVLQDLEPGEYKLAAAEVTSGDLIYEPIGPQLVRIEAGQSASAQVAYSIAGGTLFVSVSGLPQGVAAAIEISGPGGSTKVVASGSLTGLQPGVYSIAVAEAGAGDARYSGVPAMPTVSVASRSLAGAYVTYTVIRGSLSVSVTGLPAGSVPTLTVTGPEGFSRSIAPPATLSGLIPGAYTVSGPLVTIGLNRYMSSGTTVGVSSAKQNAATVSYVVERGSLTVAVSGLPDGERSDVVVSGPSGLTQTLNATATVSGLIPGEYSALARSVTTRAGYEFAATPAQRTVNVTSGASSTISFEYATSNGVNYRIDRVYLVQTAQDAAASVPIVAGKAALVRVFGTGNNPGLPRPPARLSVYDGATQVATYSSPGAGLMSTAFDESEFGSWNFPLTAAVVRPGLRLSVTINPDRTFTEANYSDNAWPAGGGAQSVALVSLPPVNLLFVPLRNGSGGVGNVSTANMNDFLPFAADLHPAAFVPALREPVQVSPLQLKTLTQWQTALQELWLVRMIDGSTAHYFGLAAYDPPVDYGGAGFVGLPASVGLDWILASASGPFGAVPYPESMVTHELGHNWGRLHAPCGTAEFLDASYPFSNGSTGSFGWRSSLGRILAPDLTDFMSYCGPGWASAYNYKAILQFRQSSAALREEGTPRRVIVVSGSIGHDGHVSLWPTIEVFTRPLSPRDGPFRLRAFGPGGRALREVAFAGDVIDHLSGLRSFAFTLDASTLGGLDAIEVDGPVNRVRLTSPAALRVDPPREPSLTRVGSGRVRVSWDTRESDRVVVLDSRNRRVIGFLRGGTAELWTDAPSMTLLISDGVRTRTVELR